MYICIGENENDAVAVGRGSTPQEAISLWCGEIDILDYMREYQKWKPLVVEGEEKQVDFEVIIRITNSE